MATIDLNDLYGGSSQIASGPAAAATPTGSAQAMAAAPGAQPGPPASPSGPAFSWVAMIAVLVGIRVLYEYAD